MPWRRLLPLIVLIALVAAPFGRMAAAEAVAPAHHAAMTAPGHCDDMPVPDGDAADKALDCLTACAMLAAVEAASLPLWVAGAQSHRMVPPLEAAGLTTEAEPPPPRPS